MSPARLFKWPMDAIARLKARLSKDTAHIKLGKLGEDLAVNALRAAGYRIAERNIKIDKREVDVIAVDGDALVFIEVKTRSNRSHGKPMEAVTKKRSDRLRKAANLYVMKKKMKPESVRFDVVTVDFAENPEGNVEIVRNAF